MNTFYWILVAFGIAALIAYIIYSSMQKEAEVKYPGPSCPVKPDDEANEVEDANIINEEQVEEEKE